MKVKTIGVVIRWVRKLLLLLAGVFIMSFGGALCVKSQIGMAPTTVIPLVLSKSFPRLTFGSFTAIFNIFLVFLQIALLRKAFQPWQLLQFLVALLFGVTVDFAVGCLQGITATAYWEKCLCSVGGAVLIGFGIALEILSDSIPAPADSTVRAISQVTGKEFSTVKTLFDCGQVATAALISLIFLRRIEALREGTLFLAVCTGTVVRFFTKKFDFLRKFTE